MPRRSGAGASSRSRRRWTKAPGAPAPFKTSDMAGVLDALGVARRRPPPAPLANLRPTSRRRATARSPTYYRPPRARTWRRPCPRAGGVPVIDGGAAALDAAAVAAAQPQGRRSPVLPEPGLAPDARRPWSRPAQRPAPPPAARATAAPPPPAPSVQPVLPMPGAPPILFVVDASNVALRHGNKETFSCRGVEICLTTWEDDFPGARVALFLPYYLLDARKVAAKKKLVAGTCGGAGRRASTCRASRGAAFFSGTPSQDYDDAYQIEYARNHDGVIISNDLFRDAVDKQPFHAAGGLSTWNCARMSFAFIGYLPCPNPEFQLPF